MENFKPKKYFTQDQIEALRTNIRGNYIGTLKSINYYLTLLDQELDLEYYENDFNTIDFAGCDEVKPIIIQFQEDEGKTYRNAYHEVLFKIDLTFGNMVLLDLEKQVLNFQKKIKEFDSEKCSSYISKINSGLSRLEMDSKGIDHELTIPQVSLGIMKSAEKIKVLRSIDYRMYFLNIEERLLVMFIHWFKNLIEALKIQHDYGTIIAQTPSVNKAYISMAPQLNSDLVTSLFDSIKTYFDPKQRSQLEKLLNGTELPIEKLHFKAAGNRLADVFWRLICANQISGTKKDLEQWVQENFTYENRGDVKSFTLSYLNKIISSQSSSCKDPIIDLAKAGNGKYQVVSPK